MSQAGSNKKSIEKGLNKLYTDFFYFSTAQGTKHHRLVMSAKWLTLFILMDFPKYIDTISMGDVF